MCSINDAWKNQFEQGGVLMEVVMVDQALARLSLLVWCLAPEPPHMQYTRDKGRAGYIT